MPGRATRPGIAAVWAWRLRAMAASDGRVRGCDDRSVAVVTPDGVLRALDETLKALIQRELGNVGWDRSGDVEAPERDRAATWPSPAVNLFLCDLREPELPRDRTWHHRLATAARRSSTGWRCAWSAPSP